MGVNGGFRGGVVDQLPAGQGLGVGGSRECIEPLVDGVERFAFEDVQIIRFGLCPKKNTSLRSWVLALGRCDMP